MRRALGVCYYPEHWPEDRWPEDAARMARAGIVWVRIAEFAWSRLEPSPGLFAWDWLDRAIDALAGAGLKIVLGTPTCTPPRWMLDKHPDMLAWDAEGRPRKFGSRRHYCFSHDGYRDEAVRIARLMGERYGRDPRIHAWQIDNEYDCHDTAVSWSPSARDAFRLWLAERYGDVSALNAAWGNVFWSMDYDRFDQIDPPNLTVTEPNPAHVLAFRRFASDQVVRFNRAQAQALRAQTDAPLIHNYMGRLHAFDHWQVGADLDVASWDSYPLGFLSDRLPEVSDAHRARYLQQGDPDFQAFHHDLYRGVGRGRWWVMEQQPGPVNWAPWNPAPLPGMVRLWSWEAFAHGAEVVSYFRWRQVPFGQEQMHAGLLLPDGEDAPALAEAAQVARELAEAPDVASAPAPVALVFDYPSAWAWEAQPQGADFGFFALIFDAYRALRRAGLSVDVIPAETADLSPWRAVLAPGVATLPPSFPSALETCRGVVVLGPRTGAKTAEMSIPTPLPPNLPDLDLRITAVESLPPGAERPLQGGGAFQRWVEHAEGNAEALWRTADGRPALLAAGALRYLAGWPDAAGWDRLVAHLAERAGLETRSMPEGLRLRDAADARYVFNHAPEPQDFDGRTLPPAGVLRLPR